MEKNLEELKGKNHEELIAMVQSLNVELESARTDADRYKGWYNEECKKVTRIVETIRGFISFVK